MEAVEQDMELAPQIAAAGEGSFMALTFELEGERFAIEVATVHEVIDPLPFTKLPNADPFAPGLINARGAVVPVLNLQHRLGVAQREHTPDTRYIILENDIGEERTKCALVADSVHEVVEVEQASIQPAPEIGLKWAPEFIRGIAQRDEELLIFLDAEVVFRPDLAA